MKTFKDWVKEKPGRTRDLAAHMSVSPSAVSQWRETGVPLDRMADVVTYSCGELTIEGLALESIAAKRSEAAQ